MLWTTITRNNIWSCKARIHDMNPIQRLDMWNVIGLVFNYYYHLMKCGLDSSLGGGDKRYQSIPIQISRLSRESHKLGDLIKWRSIINDFPFVCVFWLLQRRDKKKNSSKLCSQNEWQKAEDLMMPLLKEEYHFPLVVLHPKLDLPTGLRRPTLSQLHYSTVKLFERCLNGPFWDQGEPLSTLRGDYRPFINLLDPPWTF